MSLDRGFTLIEVLVSIVVLSIGLAGSLLVFTTVASYNADPLLIQQSVNIGKSYLEEIMSKQFVAGACGAPPGGGRAVYTTICDYDGLVDNGARNHNNQAILGLEDYQVQVSIASGSAALGGLTAGTEVKRIDVTVSHSRVQAMTISGYRTNY